MTRTSPGCILRSGEEEQDDERKDRDHDPARYAGSAESKLVTPFELPGQLLDLKGDFPVAFLSRIHVSSRTGGHLR